MRPKVTLTAMLSFWVAVFLCGSSVVWSQTPIPRGVPFDEATSLHVQQEPPGGWAIRAGRLFDPKSGTDLTNQVILVKGGKIVDVGPADKVQIPADAAVIDLSQETVLPGLIDMHVHLFNTPPLPNESRKALRAVNLGMRDMLGGFTTLTDMGSRDTYASVEYRNAINRGWVPGPRLQVAGPQLNPGHGVYPAPSIPSSFGEGSYLTGHPNWQQWENPNSPEEMTQDVRDHARYGTDLVKMYSTDDYSGSGYGMGAWRPDDTLNIYPSMTLAEARAGVVEAHRRGLTVACHAFGGEGLRDCLQSGVDIPMHILEGVTGAPGLDEETIKLFKTPLDNGKQRPACQTLWDLIGSEEARDLKDTGGKETHFTLVEKSFKRLVGAGVPEIFCSGVYALAHGTQASQFPFFVKWGMSPADALRTATSNAATALNYGLGNYVGYVEKGRYADIIAVPGDPLQDISVMEDVKFVMKGGAVFRNDLAPGATPIVLMKPASAHVDQFENTD